MLVIQLLNYQVVSRVILEVNFNQETFLITVWIIYLFVGLVIRYLITTVFNQHELIFSVWTSFVYLLHAHVLHMSLALERFNDTLLVALLYIQYSVIHIYSS